MTMQGNYMPLYYTAETVLQQHAGRNGYGRISNKIILHFN